MGVTASPTVRDGGVSGVRPAARLGDNGGGDFETVALGGDMVRLSSEGRMGLVGEVVVVVVALVLPSLHGVDVTSTGKIAS